MFGLIAAFTFAEASELFFGISTVFAGIDAIATVLKNSGSDENS